MTVDTIQPADQLQTIRVSVVTEYVQQQSQPEQNQFAFAYHITIENQGDVAAKLLGRHWIIIDANQERKEIRGMGVIGEQPVIEAGASYQYTSGVVLKTPIGTMEGSYQLLNDKGDPFDAAIAPFLLSTPNAVH
jgi:ApaG protein|tara:strand:+ start:5689 stop:6090 length:402 start_codon:yes stop_codon:yes gene_type:complete